MKQTRCPTCGVAIFPCDTECMPFCSTRCQQLDLGRWLEEQHGLPIEPEDRGDVMGGQMAPDDDELAD